MSLAELLQKYPDDEAAEEFFVEQRWPDSVACPKCGNCDVLKMGQITPKCGSDAGAVGPIFG